MKELSGSELAKKRAAEKACELVKDGMAVGLGTGSTAAYAIRLLGRRVRDEGLDIVGVPTSYASEELAIESGIPLVSLAERPELDIDIDGADQVDASLNLIKGGGAAHTREKVVACSSRLFVVVIDDKKMKDLLSRPVPIEVLPYARRLVERKVAELGGRCMMRMGMGKDGPIISDNGNIIMDCDFGPIESPALLSQKLSAIPGLVEHGIFTNADIVYIGYEDRAESLKRDKNGIQPC
ncbi:ribose-5-phosphate isomerase RpiA [Methanocella conradii]|uniref:ribose-5-phosphate isomerase RpiA n=1 Tax=Methanocella conradii TaxID=1175444 RepID=UPI0024B36D40|nr:ribose-5-phosphate isomerase RpiA [Methanocella conradii]MDI6897423.1 ribose-5-phosphate isomerase RpiA [Methanocella conradii]